jgi:ATP-dependent DNA ligase
MRFKPMLAYPVNNKPIDYTKKVFIQPKLDGVRCLIQCDQVHQYKWDKVTAYSRTGKEWKNIDHILARTNDVYQCKRSHNLRKLKDFEDSEALLLDWVEGLGKRKGTIGKFMAQDMDGNVFGMPVMDKFKYLQDNFEEMKTWVGKMATFKYFERTKAGSYRHPLFKAIREYE